jgi:signal transduction histidine kinase
MPFDENVCAARMRSLARLARPTAHEVRGALSAIYIKLELLGGTLAADEAAARRHLAGLKEQCTRIQRLTDAFLTLAALPDAPADADAGTMVALVVDAVRPLAAASRVALESTPVASQPCSGPGIEACRQRLLDVLIEALASATAGSAIHVGPVASGGAVRVRDAAGTCTDVALPSGENRPDA